MKIVVVGGSSAGGSLCETARSLDSAAEITLVSKEPWPMYSRCLLPKYISEEKTLRELEFRSSNWATRLNVRVILNRAASISPADHVVQLESGERLAYDCLGIATGASAARPRIPGLEAQGVFDLYTLDSAQAMRAWLPHVRSATILGAGLIGMKAAAALVHLNKQVVIVEQKATVLPDTLDTRAAERMRRHFVARGVRVVTNETVAEVLLDKRQRLRGVRLASGDTVECDMLVCAVGSRPNVELIREAGGETAQGALVNEYLETSLPGVFAAGDVAEVPMLNTARVLTTANWFNSKREGRMAAFNMLRERTVYRGRMRANAVELLGLAMVSVGQVQPEAGEEQVLDEPSSPRYRKLILQDDRLVGLILLGDISEAGALTDLIQNGRALALLKDRLLREGIGCLPSTSLASLSKKERAVQGTLRAG
jgi:NAD(P)H-nitrite reductase large subunit